MPRRLYKRYVPDHRRFREHKHLQMFGERLHDPNLWHLNRRSAAGAMAAGMFIAFIPVPGQIFIAAAAAIALRVNLPLAVLTIFITNPLTMPPIFFFTYKVGALILGIQPHPFAFEPSPGWLIDKAGTIGTPLLLGSLLVGTVLAALTYAAVRLLWRLDVTRRRRTPKRSTSRAAGRPPDAAPRPAGPPGRDRG